MAIWGSSLLNNFTNINCVSSIGLDCTSFINKVSDSGWRGENKKKYLWAKLDIAIKWEYKDEI